MFLVKKVSKTKGFNDAIKFDMKGNKRVVKTYCGADVVMAPLHFTQFYSTYQLSDRPRTLGKTLEKAHEIAEKEGIPYAYIGNAPGHRFEDTLSQLW